MTQPIDKLDDWILKLRGLGDLTKEIAPDVAAEFRSQLEAQIAAGTDSNGTQWQLTKDGKQPLRNAAKALRVSSQGSVVTAQLTGPEALHHLGKAKGHVRRQILPSKRLPKKLIEAIKAVVAKRMKAL